MKDSFSHRYFQVRYNSRKPPIRPRIILSDLKLHPRKLFRYDDYLESSNKLSGSGQFSSVEFAFTPRDTTATCDTLDLNLSCTFGKPYDFYIETNYTNKINGRTGPELVIGFTKRNAFRGGEKLDINLHGSYEWPRGVHVRRTLTHINPNAYCASESNEYPAIAPNYLSSHP